MANEKRHDLYMYLYFYSIVQQNIQHFFFSAADLLFLEFFTLCHPNGTIVTNAIFYKVNAFIFLCCVLYALTRLRSRCSVHFRTMYRCIVGAAIIYFCRVKMKWKKISTAILYVFRVYIPLPDRADLMPLSLRMRFQLNKN